MVDVNKHLGQFLDGRKVSGFESGMMGGLVSKSGRKMGKSTLNLAGMAAVCALAYTAYQRFSNAGSDTAATPVPAKNDSVNKILLAQSGSAFLPEQSDQSANEALGLTLVWAMIAVVRADGRLDAQESQAIFQKINSLGLDSESQNLLVQEMGHPVDVDNSAEKAYLAMLAARLQLPPALVTELEAQVEAQKVSVQ